MRAAIPVYVQWKYEADKNLVKRDAFKWTILRPGGLKDEPGTGKATVGRTHLTPQISVSSHFILIIIYRRMTVIDKITRIYVYAERGRG